MEIVSGKLKWYKVDGPGCESKDSVQQEDTVTVTYNGFTDTRFKFNSGDEEYTFAMSDARVLQGMREGMAGMCIGERRRLRIPPELAVGDVNEGKATVIVRVNACFSADGLSNRNIPLLLTTCISHFSSLYLILCL